MPPAMRVSSCSSFYYNEFLWIFLVAATLVATSQDGSWVAGFTSPTSSHHGTTTRAAGPKNTHLTAHRHLTELPATSTTDREDLSTGRRSFLGTSAATTAMTFSSLFRSTAAAETTTTTTTTTDTTAKPRIVLWGYGNQNQLMAQYLDKKNMNVVAVVSRHDIGEDYGRVESPTWGGSDGSILGKSTGIRIVDEAHAAAELERTQPNICLLCTRSTLEDIRPALMVCANSKVNVITIAEELLDSTTSSPTLTKQMDTLFKANGVTLTGSGFIDGACCEMTTVMASMMQKITGLEGGLQYNVDEYGAVLAQAHGVGLTKPQFAKFAKTTSGKSYVYNSNEWFVSALGLTLRETKEVRQPIFSTLPMESAAMGRTIPVGDCTGMKVVCTTTTQEGVTIVSEQIGRLYQPNDEDKVFWRFQGEPAGVGFTMDHPPTPQMTNTATISRIPQVLAAPPGYITTNKLDFGRYQHVL